MSEIPGEGQQPSENLPAPVPSPAPAPSEWPSGYPEAAEAPGATASSPVVYAQTSNNAVIALVLAIASWVGWGL